MRLPATALLASLMLIGCQSAPPKEEPVSDTLAQKGEWQASTLPAATVAKINATNLDYQQCLSAEVDAQAAQVADPRAIGDSILRHCEDRLKPIKTALDEQGVPAAISERYIRKNRSQGAQKVMRAVQFVHAQRAAEQEEARQQAATTPSKKN